jgi:hypothetical protein
LVNDLLRTIKSTGFVGSSKKDLWAFPRGCPKRDRSLFEAQQGEHLRNAKPLKGLSGVLGIRVCFDGDTYRTVYHGQRAPRASSTRFRKGPSAELRHRNGALIWCASVCGTPM